MTLRKLTINFVVPTKAVEDGTGKIINRVKQVSVVSTQSMADMESKFKKAGISVSKVTTELDNQVTIARKQAREINASERNMERLRRELDASKKATTLNVDEQRVLANQMRLGAGATEKQRAEVAQLTRELISLERQNKRGRTSFRNLRNQTGQLGHQFQDIAVQAQAGTDAFIILGQQGSQIASIMGPQGPLIGAGIAVGSMLVSMLAPSLLGASGATKKLEKATKDLDRVIRMTDDGGVELSSTFDFIVKKYGFLEDAVRRMAIQKAMEQNKLSVKALDASFTEILGKVSKLQEGTGSVVTPTGFVSPEILVKFSEAGERVRDTLNVLKKEASPEALLEFNKAIKALSDETKPTDKEVQNFIATSLELIKVLDQTVTGITDLKNENTELTKTQTENGKKVKETIEQLEKQVRTYHMSNTEIALYEANVLKANDADLQRIGVLSDQIELNETLDSIFENGRREREARAKVEAKLNQQANLYIDNLRASLDPTNALITADKAWMVELKKINPEIYDQIKALEAQSEAQKKSAKEAKLQENMMERLNRRGEDRIANLEEQLDPTDELIEADARWMKQLRETNPVIYDQIKALEALLQAKRQEEQAEMRIQQVRQVALYSARATTEQLGQILKEGTALAKANFIFQQALAAAQVMVNYELMKAKFGGTETMFFGQKVAMDVLLDAQKAVSLGVIAGTTVAGVFHNGGGIPTDGTYLMQGGEYVESKAERREIDKLVSKPKEGSSGIIVNVTNKISAFTQIDADRAIMQSGDAVLTAVRKGLRREGRTL